MNISKELNALIDAKQGNSDLALFYVEGYAWTLALGNPTEFVMLGETPGEYQVDGKSIEECITKMQTLLNTETANLVL